MTYRAFFLLVATLLLLEILAYFLGQEVKLWAIVAIGIFGMLGIWQREKLIASVTAYWHALSPEGRQRTLVHVEEWVDRPQVADRLGEPLPRVPIRGGSEVFRYPEGVHRTTSWMFGLSFMMVIVTMAATAQDAARGKPIWPDGIVVVSLFTAGAAFFGWQTWRTPFEVEVTEEYLATRIRGARATTIHWHSITTASYNGLSQMMVIRSPGKVVRFAYTLEGYGRLVNIVASRAAMRSRAV